MPDPALPVPPDSKPRRARKAKRQKPDATRPPRKKPRTLLTAVRAICPVGVLARCFRDALSDYERANLAWHEERETPICCGMDAHRFVDPRRGAG